MYVEGRLAGCLARLGRGWVAVDLMAVAVADGVAVAMWQWRERPRRVQAVILSGRKLEIRACVG
jgi:predicted hotdog family 3-hydroxylacyl-ACP dehydratase